MSINWNQYPRVDGQIIYDEKLDKSKQIGMASIALYKAILGMAQDELGGTENFKYAKTIATQMRFFIVGNNNKSATSLNYALSAIRQINISSDLMSLLFLCVEVVKAIVANQEYVDILLNGTSTAGIYCIDNIDEVEPILELEA